MYNTDIPSEKGAIPMELTVTEKVKIILGRRNMTAKELAEKLGMSRQSLANRFAHNNWTEKDIQRIADAMDCTYNAQFIMNDTGETI